jgi:hypothetical protein
MAVGQALAQRLVECAEASVAEAGGDALRSGAQGLEVVDDQTERADDLADAGAVEGDDPIDVAGAAVLMAQQVEGGGEMAAEAVAGDGEVLSFQRAARLGQLGVPRFHVADLAERPAEFLDLHGVGRHAVAQRVVDEFGAADAEDVLLFGFVVEQRSAETRGRVRKVVNDDPVFDELLRFGRSESAGVFVAGGQPFGINNSRIVIAWNKQRRNNFLRIKAVQRFRRHLQVGVLEHFGNQGSSHDQSSFFGIRIWSTNCRVAVPLETDGAGHM